jgi:hypothetical protein
MDTWEYTEDTYCLPVLFKSNDIQFKENCQKYKCIEKSKKDFLLDQFISLYGFSHMKIKQYCKLNKINARNFKNWFIILRNKMLYTSTKA